MTKGLFITATGTDAGKTYLTGLMIKKMRESGYTAGYYKAALSGAERKGGALIPGDADHVKRTAGLTEPFSQMVSYIYETAVSPHLAAEIEGPLISEEKVLEDYKKACLKYDYITVEGSGGIICPIRREKPQLMLTDLIKAMNLGVLIVAPAQLGTINSTILTIEYARTKGIPVRGVMLNYFHPSDRMEEDNKRFIEEYTGVPVLACVKELEQDLPMDGKLLAELYR